MTMEELRCKVLMVKSFQSSLKLKTKVLLRFLVRSWLMPSTEPYLQLDDDLRPAMSGVYCQFSGNEIVFVATDAHKLVRYKRNDAKSSDSSTLYCQKNH